MNNDPNTPISDGIHGGLHEGGVKADGSKRVTANIMGPTIAELDLLAGIIGEPCVVLLTSSKWARVAREVMMLRKDINPENFSRLDIRGVIFAKADSDDQQAVNFANVPEAERVNFQNRRQQLISGKR